MACQIIQFPIARVISHPDVIHALECLALLDDYEVSGDPVKEIVAGPMRKHWEGELERLGGVPRCDLKRDGLVS